MASSSRFRWLPSLHWRWLRIPFWLGLGLLAGFMAPYTLVLNTQVQARFNDLVFSVPTRVYARSVPIATGEAMRPAALEQDLEFSGYTDDGQGATPGTWMRHGATYVISSRGFASPDGSEPPQRIRVTLGHGQIESVVNLATGSSDVAYLDPARIATLYGARQVERRLVTLKQVPGLLITGLQAVEDRDFKHHFGIDVSAIARAAWADLRAGHVVEGGSTLTQQLVRNLFLDRNQSLVRKANEALLAVLIETHYSKRRILEAYVNEVFLGQQGNQAVHGFAAASEFYFGRRVQELDPDQIALLVGLVRGPSYYDPRHFPKRALARRNRVLGQFHDTGLISQSALEHARSQPLGVKAQPQLPRDRFPAFMDLVRAQITADFSDAQLRHGGLSIFTTLDPAAQLDAEHAVTDTLKSMGKAGANLQAAAVVTDAQSGNVLAMVGGRDPQEHGFNRAMYARRPVGSIIKPFVYMVALTQPDRWSLATLLDDAPITLKQPNGTLWQPQNDDHTSHGQVPLLDALVHSWNLATVHLGLAVGVKRIQQFVESFGIGDVNPNPSLLLGAIDLAPLQVAQMYQYFAADGHALPLMAVRGVMNDQGQAIKRYAVRLGSGEYQSAAELTTYAMQQVAVRGTAHAIGQSGLSWLHAAGKTGTSDDQRDSWFAGFTGTRLAVVWMGRDDNKPTHLWGSSGALRVWMRLFEQLPTRPLPDMPQSGIDYAWVNPQTGHRTDQSCAGAQRMPFIAGHVPEHEDGCFWQHVRGVFGGDDAGHKSDQERGQP